MHSVSASGSMHSYESLHLSSCFPEDVRACTRRRARPSRSPLTLTAAVLLPPGVPSSPCSPLSWA